MHISVSGIVSVATTGVKLARWLRERRRAIARRRIAMATALVLALVGAVAAMWRLGAG